MNENQKYWAKEVIEIAESSLLQIKKFENRTCELRNKLEEFIKEIKKFDDECCAMDAVDFDINLILDIIKREMVNAKSGSEPDNLQ